MSRPPQRVLGDANTTVVSRDVWPVVMNERSLLRSPPLPTKKPCRTEGYPAAEEQSSRGRFWGCCISRAATYGRRRWKLPTDFPSKVIERMHIDVRITRFNGRDSLAERRNAIRGIWRKVRYGQRSAYCVRSLRHARWHAVVEKREDRSTREARRSVMDVCHRHVGRQPRIGQRVGQCVTGCIQTEAEGTGCAGSGRHHGDRIYLLCRRKGSHPQGICFKCTGS